MERRSHRIAVLAAVVLMHVPVFFALRAVSAPERARDFPSPLRVEFVLNEPSASRPPPPAVRRSRAGATATAPDTAIDTAPARRTAREARAPVPVPASPPPPARLFADDGTLRIPATLADDITERPVEGPRTFHLPAGDAWVLREPRSPLEYTDTRFARAFLPEGMNPVEEACWRHKGLAFVLTMLGSRDCADPGGPDPRPTPEMIVYGVDDADDILRKTEDWARYNAR